MSKSKCKCGGEMKPIVYGLPSGDLFNNKDVFLGGCLISPGAPTSKCNKCGRTKGKLKLDW